MPHSGMLGPPCGPALRRIRTWSGVTSRSLAGAGLHHAAVRREVAGQDGKRAFLIDRGLGRADHVVVVDSDAVQDLAPSLSADRSLIQIEMRVEPRHQRQQAAGIIEVLHQVRAAAGPHIGDHRHAAAGGVGLQHAALHILDPLLEVRVAGIDVGPCVDDGDDRPASPILAVIAHLHEARAMAEAAQMVRRFSGSPAFPAGVPFAFHTRYRLPSGPPSAITRTEPAAWIKLKSRAKTALRTSHKSRGARA